MLQIAKDVGQLKPPHVICGPCAAKSFDLLLEYLQKTEWIKKHFKEHPIDLGDVHRLNWIADPSLRVGECRIETPLGLVNFDLKRLLLDLEKKVLEVQPQDLRVPSDERESPSPSTPTQPELLRNTSNAQA